jgi:hypothetical protein
LFLFLFQDLSPAAVKALISSSEIQAKSENEIFWLMLAWVEAQSEESEEGKQELFTQMTKQLYFSEMDPGYILLMVSEHPRIISAGMQSKVLKECLTRANLARRTSDEVQAFEKQRTTLTKLFILCSGKSTWTFNVRFRPAEAAAIDPNGGCRKVVGLGAGMPWYIELHRTAGEMEVQQAAMYTMCGLPFEWMTFRNGAGFYYHYTLQVGVGTENETAFTDDGKRRWTGDIAGGKCFASWADLFREGSMWLVNGELHVKLTLTIIRDQGPI